jgi:branched-chain amino acid transport system ATP-binding protein
MRLAADGLAVCLVEHDVSLVMQVCSTITVLDYGAVLARGTAAEIRDDPAVVAAYLGTAEGAA